MITNLTQLQVNNKRVLVRVDYNVPMKDGIIQSDLRMVESLPTIKYLLNNGAKVILCSHFGRPEGKFNEKYSLKPVYEHLKELLPTVKTYFCADILAEETLNTVNQMLAGELCLLENVRFYEGEEKNSEEFVDSLARLADMFVFDAFGSAHRKHASTVGIAYKLPSAVGFLVNKELTAFDKVLNNPKKPIVAILGGAKINDKIGIIENLLNKVDTILIGGGMCFTFLKALKARVGNSIVDDSKIEVAYDIIKKAIDKKVEIILPKDFVCAQSINDDNLSLYNVGEIPDDLMGLDIGPKTIKLFAKKIKKAKTIIWNGPLGAYENENFENGTNMIAYSVAKNKKCYSVVGGGDVVSALQQSGYAEFISHISTGGGAGLKLLEGKSLFAITAIQNSKINQ